VLAHVRAQLSRDLAEHQFQVQLHDLPSGPIHGPGLAPEHNSLTKVVPSIVTWALPGRTNEVRRTDAGLALGPGRQRRLVGEDAGVWCQCGGAASCSDGTHAMSLVVRVPKGLVLHRGNRASTMDLRAVRLGAMPQFRQV
jgi:hypothetical protein